VTPDNISDINRNSHAIVLLGSREYVVEQQLVLKNAGPGKPEKQNLWVALIRDFHPYQEIESQIIEPTNFTLVIDEFGNRYAEFDLSDHPPGSEKIIEITTRVIINELQYDLSSCTGDLSTEFLKPELHIESDNPQIVSLAEKLAPGNITPCKKARIFYDYVGDELTYTYNGENWGAQAALGPMGADCTEYSSLMAALSRAAGVPARYFEGLRYLGDGESADALIQHAWPDVYLPGVGWVGMDPTLARLPVNRETYFAHYTPDHIIVTLGSSPSTLRGSSYWTHLYWPGDATRIVVENPGWKIELVKESN
jgi:transglutaminase-like putative cysteine protease